MVSPSLADLHAYLFRLAYEAAVLMVFWDCDYSVPSDFLLDKTVSSGSDRRERMVRSVLNGQSVLFYHYRFSWIRQSLHHDARLMFGRPSRVPSGS